MDILARPVIGIRKGYECLDETDQVNTYKISVDAARSHRP